MVPITVGVAAPRGSLAYDSLSRALLANRGVYAVVGVSTDTESVDANRGVGVIVGLVLDPADVAWIRRIRDCGDATPVIAICRPGLSRLALAAGAQGIVSPEDDRLDLERALAACSRGATWVPITVEGSDDQLQVVPEPLPAVEPVPAPAVPQIAVAAMAAIEVAPAGLAIEEADPTEIAEIVAMARSRASA